MSVEYNAIARPYAKALFELAHEQKKVVQWGKLLAKLAAFFSHADVHRWMTDPRIPAAVFAECCIDYLKLKKAEANLLRVLAEHKRLPAIPAIAAMFHQRCAAEQDQVNGVLTSAMPVTKAQVDKVAKALSKQLSKQVELVSEVDESLLGGAMIRVGDVVYDGSVRGKLERLTKTLMS